MIPAIKRFWTSPSCVRSIDPIERIFRIFQTYILMLPGESEDIAITLVLEKL